MNPIHCVFINAGTHSPPPLRKIKVEATGDFWTRILKPKIRLMGCWLERAGLRPGDYAFVSCLAPGIIELRSTDVRLTNEVSQPVAEPAPQAAAYSLGPTETK